MSKGKGKGKEREAEEPSEHRSRPRKTANAEGGLVSRVSNSALGLAGSLILGQPTANDLSGVTPNGKATSSTQSQSSTELQSAGDSSSLAQPSSSSEDNFRASHTQEHIAQQEADFSNFLDNAPELTEPYYTNLEPSREFTSRDIPKVTQAEPGSSDIARQMLQDGREVRNLLSLVDTEPPYFAAELVLSDEDSSSLRKALFEASSSSNGVSRQDWDYALNFIPDFVRPNAPGGHMHGPEGMEKSKETLSSLGIVHSPEASKMWVDQWYNVLKQYTDEVWGGLEPLVEDARQELKDLREDRQPPNLSALLRLRQILDHVRRPYKL